MKGEVTMEYLWIILLPLAIWVIITAAIKTPGTTLAQRFASLGTLAGKSESEIVASVGRWTSRSAIGEGRYSLQWLRANYHIALLFTQDGICEGVSHEFLMR